MLWGGPIAGTVSLGESLGAQDEEAVEQAHIDFFEVYGVVQTVADRARPDWQRAAT